MGERVFKGRSRTMSPSWSFLMGNRLLFRDFFLIQNYWTLLFKDSLSSQPTKELKKHLEHNEQTNQNHHQISSPFVNIDLCAKSHTTLDPFPDERSWKSFRLARNCSRQSIKASQTLETAHSSATGNW